MSLLFTTFMSILVNYYVVDILKIAQDFLDLQYMLFTGQIHYENLCMKAVNQSVGRAIRDKLMNEINFINV